MERLGWQGQSRSISGLAGEIGLQMPARGCPRKEWNRHSRATFSWGARSAKYPKMPSHARNIPAGLACQAGSFFLASIHLGQKTHGAFDLGIGLTSCQQKHT